MAARTFTITCPHCAADVEALPKDMRVHVELRGYIEANVDFLGKHRCAATDAQPDTTSYRDDR